MRAPASDAQVRELWRHGEKKGGYSKLESSARCALRALDELHGTEELAFFAAHAAQLEGPERPLAFTYDFLELHAGEAVLSAEGAAMGLRVGPPIDI